MIEFSRRHLQCHSFLLDERVDHGPAEGVCVEPMATVSIGFHSRLKLGIY